MANELKYRGSYANPVITAYENNAIENYIASAKGQADFKNPVDASLNAPALNTLGVKWDDAASNEDQLARIMVQRNTLLCSRCQTRHGQNSAVPVIRNCSQVW